MGRETILVTGASGGIGQALCEILIQEGYWVIGTDIKVSQSEISYFIQYDLRELVCSDKSRNEFYCSIMAAVNERRLKAIINNAAIQITGSTGAIQLQDFQNTLDINVTVPFILTQMFLNELEQNEGSVINIGSIHAKATKPKFVSYATSKTALLGLTQALAVDLGLRGICVNAIQPAATHTDMLMAGFDGLKDNYKRLKYFHPLNRIAEPDDIAHAVVFLLSKHSRFISGSVINIDGGIGVRLHDPE